MRAVASIPETKKPRETLNGVPFSYWLASPYASNSTYFRYVRSDGSSNYATASYSYGVCFGFDI